MNNINITHDITIDAPATEVWSLVADYARDGEWRSGVTSMVASPAGTVTVGTTTVEHIKLGGREWRNDGVVTEVTPGERFAWRTTSGASAHGSRAVEAVGPCRTRLRLELTVVPRRSEKLMAPLIARLLDRNMKRDLARIGGIVCRLDDEPPTKPARRRAQPSDDRRRPSPTAGTLHQSSVLVDRPS